MAVVRKPSDRTSRLNSWGGALIWRVFVFDFCDRSVIDFMWQMVSSWVLKMMPFWSFWEGSCKSGNYAPARTGSLLTTFSVTQDSRKTISKKQFKKTHQFRKMYWKWSQNEVQLASSFWRFRIPKPPGIEGLTREGSPGVPNQVHDSKIAPKWAPNHENVIDNSPTKGKTSQKIGEHSVIFLNTFRCGIFRQSTDTCIKNQQKESASFFPQR